jgi:ribose transport system substrate-binding protein
MYPDKIKGLVITNANDSVPKQISDMEDMLVKGVDAILVAPTDSTALCPVIEKAMSQGVPVIILERGVNCTDYVTFIDANAAGQAGFQATWLVNQLGGQGNVVYMGIIPGITISGVTEATVNGIFAQNKGIKELAFDYAWVSRSKGKTLMEAWLRAYPKIDGVIGWSGAEIMGALEAAQEAGRDKQIKAWVGADDMGWLQLIADGKVNGAGYIGYADCSIDGLQAAIKTLSGQPVPYYWKLPVIGITKDNVAKYLIPNAPEEWFPSRYISADQMQKWVNAAGAY